jgi:TonB family protein
MNHLDEGQIQAFLDDQLNGRDRASAAAHLMWCGSCRGLHEELRGAQASFSDAIPLLDAAEPRNAALPPGLRRRRASVGAVRTAAVLVLFSAAAAAAAAPGSPIRDWILSVVDQEAESTLPRIERSTAALPSTEPAAVVTGTVLDAAGEPLAFAQVSLGEGLVATWTDEEGGYRLSGSIPGDWEVQVVHPGYEPVRRHLRVPGEGQVTANFRLRTRPGPTADPLGDFEPFHVSFTLPALLNTDAIMSAIERVYPENLADRGVGGEAVLLIWVDEQGRVARSVVSSSSGQPALDRIALSVSRDMRFRPARSGDVAVRVIVQIPVVFAPEG